MRKKYIFILSILMGSGFWCLEPVYAVSFFKSWRSEVVFQKRSNAAKIQEESVAQFRSSYWMIAELMYLVHGITGGICEDDEGLLLVPNTDFFSQPMKREKKYLETESAVSDYSLLSPNTHFLLIADSQHSLKTKKTQGDEEEDAQNSSLTLKRFIDENGDVDYRFEPNHFSGKPLYSASDYLNDLWKDLYAGFQDKNKKQPSDKTRTQTTPDVHRTPTKPNQPSFVVPETTIHTLIPQYVNSNQRLKDIPIGNQGDSNSLLIGFFDSSGILNLTSSSSFIWESLKDLFNLGSFVMSNATLTSTSLIIGDARTETFTQKSGTHTNTTLIAGYNGGTGTYELQSGSLQTADIDLGNLGGTGFFIHSGGTHNSTTIEIGKNSGSNGTYTFSGGQINTADFHIGVAGTGTLSQSNGSLDIANWLTVGLGTGTGNYFNSGGNLSASTIHIGNNSNGTITQSGGAITSGDVLFGYNGGSGTYLMNDGVLQSTNVHVGDLTGTGVFELSGGTVNISNWLAVGISNAVGSFTVTGGTLITNVLHIGNNANGTFTQSDGTVSAATVNLGFNGGTGSYTMSGGTLSATDMNISNPAGTGTVTQSGGTVNVSNWLTTGIAGGTGSYTLSGGTLNTNRVNIGFNANAGGNFIQSGGVHTPDSLFIGLNTFATTTPTYQLNAGTLTASTTTIGTNAVGRFTQMSGTHTVGTLDIGTFTGAGTYTHGGGSLSASFLVVSSDQSANNLGDSEFSITDSSASTTVTNKLIINPDARLSAVLNSSIIFDGAEFINKSTNPSDLSGLTNLNFTFQGGQGALEVAGQDMGVDTDGFISNFALNSLTLTATQLILQDVYDNQPSWSGAEALYVFNLFLGQGSVFDLNGLNVFYDTLTDGGATVQLNGGTLQKIESDELSFSPLPPSGFSFSTLNFPQSEPVPEPSVSMLIILGAIILKLTKGK